MDNAPPRPSINGPMLPLAKLALGLWLLGGKQMMEILRVCPLSIDQWLQETLDDPLLRAALAMPGLHGTWMGPLSPSSATCLLIRECLVGDEIRGGPAAWVGALAKAADMAGVVIQTDTRVTAIETDPKGTANGVTVNGNQTITCNQVLSCIGPKKTLLNLGVDRRIPDSLINEIQAVRVRGIAGKVHLALSAPFQWNHRSNERHARVQVGQHPHDLERSFDEAKHRRMPETLSLDIHIPSIGDPTLAPEGHEVVSILATGAATDLDVGWDDNNKEALGDTVIDMLTRHDPNLASKLVAREVLTPADLETEYGLEGGHMFHGELALDQLHAFRPTPQLSDFAPPLPGLYLGSNGMHPGCGLTGSPGALAAQRMLHDAKRSV